MRKEASGTTVVKANGKYIRTGFSGEMKLNGKTYVIKEGKAEILYY